MKEILQSIYKCISDVASPFKTILPFQDIEADVDAGVVTFAPTKIKNITLASERLQESINKDQTNKLIIDAVSEVSFEIDIYKSISWDNNELSAFEMAEKLQTYLKSSQARDKFYNDYKYELMPIWADITFQADFNTYKKWVQIAQFEIFITKMSSINLTDKPLKNIVMNINDVNTLKNKCEVI